MDKDKSLVWDCGSSLYDSFELKSFMRQLDSAITASSGRCMSMPHLSETAPAPRPTLAQTTKKKQQQSKLSRSIHKLLRSVFRVKSMFRIAQVQSHGYYEDHANLYGAYSRSGRLESIPEACEKESAASPEVDAAVRKTVSERFVDVAKPLAALEML